MLSLLMTIVVGSIHEEPGPVAAAVAETVFRPRCESAALLAAILHNWLYPYPGKSEAGWCAARERRNGRYRVPRQRSHQPTTRTGGIPPRSEPSPRARPRPPRPYGGSSIFALAR